MRALSPCEMRELRDVANRAAGRYARRVFWADIEDLRQEAFMAAIECATRWYDPQCGVPLAGYAWRAAVLHLRKWCWRNSSPVSETDHNLALLRGVHRTSLEPKATPDHPRRAFTAQFDDVLTDRRPIPDAAYEAAERNALIREQIEFLLAERTVKEREAALRVIRDEESARVVADSLDMPVRSVYRIARRARVLFAENAMLYSFWRSATP